MADDERTRTVSLGCGTLILIALIVLLFSRGSTEPLESEVRALRTEIAQLTEALEEHSRRVESLEQAVKRLAAAGGQGGAQ